MTALTVAAWALGVPLLVLGAMLLWWERARSWAIVSRWSVPTRLAVALSLMIAGYHAGAWASPASWGLLHVPWERGWILAAACAVAVGVSLAKDAKDG